ncbi:MAG: DNA translocase FtsK [Chloroflexota bacterium]|nr:DNA translocase FtsK [Dehalococcoidia bacterium]MDW8253141.1 DNA translocase FtsK [Chloroflexota bacterium]
MLFLFGQYLPDVGTRFQQALFAAFGLGLPLVAGVLGLAAYALWTGTVWPFPFPVRFGIAAIALWVAAYSVLGLTRPALQLGAVRLDTVSGGGHVGRWLAGGGDVDLGVVLRLGALLVLAWAACWPARAWGAVTAAGSRLRALAQRAPALLRRGRHLSGEAWRRMRQRLPSSSQAAPPPLAPAEESGVSPLPARAPAAAIVPAPPLKPSSQKIEAAFAPAGSLPPLDLLDPPVQTDFTPVDIESRVKQIETTLAEYGVDAKVVEVNQGPSVTQFAVEPGWEVRTREVRERDAEGRPIYDKNGAPKVRIEEVSRVRVKVSRILGLANDLALALAVPSVRIEAPVPGKPYVGLEVPNVSSTLVSLRRVIESPQFQRLRMKTKLAIALGQDVAGKPVVADLTRMPHCLIAGATGSGKSVCVNAMIASLLMHATPEEVRMIMVDPKRVEMVGYNDIPHLLAPVIVEPAKVVGALRWVLKEMEERYKAFADAGARNIESYNQRRVKEGAQPIPYLVVIIDELADLMMVASEEVERIIVRLAQLARATGIHLIIATQRPSVDVVTGLIKANVPTRIAFAVSSSIDSRTILDQVGAEKLLGRGDMLYAPPDALKPVRLQGVYVSDAEVDRIVAWWKAARPPQYVDELVNLPEELLDEGERDPLLEEARRLVEEHGRVSASFLQRRLRIGYNRAARLLDALEEEGTLEPPDSRRAVSAGLYD